MKDPERGTTIIVTENADFLEIHVDDDGDLCITASCRIHTSEADMWMSEPDADDRRTVRSSLLLPFLANDGSSIWSRRMSVEKIDAMARFLLRWAKMRQHELDEEMHHG
jgi:hypothetical protein